MKKTLYYSVVFGLYGPRLVAVTTERGQHWWGRTTHDDVGTHGHVRDTRGRFETLEAAEEKLQALYRVRNHFAAQRELLRRADEALRQAEQAMNRQVVSGVPHRDAAWLAADPRLTTEETPEELRGRVLADG